MYAAYADTPGEDLSEEGLLVRFINALAEFPAERERRIGIGESLRGDRGRQEG